METSPPSFDLKEFMVCVRRIMLSRDSTMSDVARETGISTPTLSRMKTGKSICDAVSLAALGAWAGINPSNFSSLSKASRKSTPSKEVE